MTARILMVLLVLIVLASIGVAVWLAMQPSSSSPAMTPRAPAQTTAPLSPVEAAALRPMPPAATTARLSDRALREAVSAAGGAETGFYYA